MTVEHHGELHESDYGFWTWVTCSCSWRSASYKTSDKAWIAHAAHADIPEMVVLDAYWEAFNRNHQGETEP